MHVHDVYPLPLIGGFTMKTDKQIIKWNAKIKAMFLKADFYSKSNLKTPFLQKNNLLRARMETF